MRQESLTATGRGWYKNPILKITCGIEFPAQVIEVPGRKKITGGIAYPGPFDRCTRCSGGKSNGYPGTSKLGLAV